MRKVDAFGFQHWCLHDNVQLHVLCYHVQLHVFRQPKVPTSLALVAEWSLVGPIGCVLQNKALAQLCLPRLSQHVCLSQCNWFALCKCMDCMWCLLSGQAALISGPRRHLPLPEVVDVAPLCLLPGAGLSAPGLVWVWSLWPLIDLGFSHYWHPLRGVRIGEAKQPGPPTADGRPLRRLTSKQSVDLDPCRDLPGEVACPGQPDSSLDTVLDDSGILEAVRVEPAPAMPDSQRAEISEVPAALDVFFNNGQKGVLKCNFLPSVRSWRWQVYPRKFDMARESRANIQAGLHAWIRQFRDQLTTDSCADIESLLASLSSHPSMVISSAQSQDAPVAPVTVTLPAPNLYKLPEACQCEEVLRTPIASILEADIICQHHLPNSVTHEVTSALLWLHKIRMKPDTPIAVAHVAEIFLICAPRLLWPLPLKDRGQASLAPHSRPRIVLERLSMLQKGQWLELWRLSMFDHSLLVPQEVSPPPVAPGLVSVSEANRVAMAVKQGSLTKAWKQLWSYGRAPRTYDGAARTWHKLNDISDPPVSQVPPLLPVKISLLPKPLLLMLRGRKSFKLSMQASPQMHLDGVRMCGPCVPPM